MKMQMIVSLFAQRDNQRHLGSEVVEVGDDMPYEEFGEVVLEGAKRIVARLVARRERNAERTPIARRHERLLARAAATTLTDFDIVLRFEPSEGEVWATLEQNAEQEGLDLNETPPDARKRNITRLARSKVGTGCTHGAYVIKEVGDRQQPVCVYCKEVLEL